MSSSSAVSSHNKLFNRQFSSTGMLAAIFTSKKENALLVFATDMQFFDFQMIGACSVNKSATYLLGCICKVQRTPMMEERPGMIVYAGPIFCY